MLRLGLPTRKHENWKYTPLDGLLNGEFVTRWRMSPGPA
jgi:Fe-S cluster assembly protein SufD